MPATSLAYRLLVDNGRATVAGRVRLPNALVREDPGLLRERPDAPLARPWRLVDEGVARATVTYVDGVGNPKAGVLPVEADADGRYVLRDVPIGEAGYVKASFRTPSGREYHAYAFLRPEAPRLCLAITLSSTVVAQQIAQGTVLADLFDPTKVDDAQGDLDARMPTILDEILDELVPPGLPTELAEATALAIVKDLVSYPGPATPPPGPIFEDFFGLPVGPKRIQDAIATVLRQDAGLVGKLAEAVETFLEANFVILAIGQNAAPFPAQQDRRHLMIGFAEVALRGVAGAFQGVKFWLNDQLVAEGVAADGGWNARVDTRVRPDGPYVLSAVAVPAGAPAERVVRRAFVYIKNAGATPADPGADCPEE